MIARHLRTALAATSLLCSVVAGAAEQTDWPILPVPEHLASFDVGHQNRLNGTPIQIRGFVTNRSIGELKQWYRQNAGGHWVENAIGNKTVLGQRRSDHFITIELEAMLGNHAGTTNTTANISSSNTTTKVVTAILDLRRPATQPVRGMDAFGDWTTRLPVSSRVLSHMTDSSATNESLHLVAVNGQSLAGNAQHFRREFRQLGFLQDVAAPAASNQAVQRNSAPGAQEKLSFTAPNTEAVVVLGRDGSGQSTVVLIINRSKR